MNQELQKIVEDEARKTVPNWMNPQHDAAYRDAKRIIQSACEKYAGRSYVPPERAHECLHALDAVKLDESKHGNTLIGLVTTACEEIQQLRQQVEGLTKDVARVRKLAAEDSTHEQRLRVEAQTELSTLRAQLEKSEKANAEMRSTLEFVSKDYDHAWPNEDEGTEMHRMLVGASIEHAISTESGKDYIHRSELDKAKELLREAQEPLLVVLRQHESRMSATHGVTEDILFLRQLTGKLSSFLK